MTVQTGSIDDKQRWMFALLHVSRGTPVTIAMAQAVFRHRLRHRAVGVYDWDMSKTISLSLPHDLTQAEARARIEKGIANARSTYGSRLGEVHEKWTDNHLDFHVRAAGQQVTGRLDVLPNDVKLEVDLPWMLALLAGKFTKQVEHEGRKLLEKK